MKNKSPIALHFREDITYFLHGDQLIIRSPKGDMVMFDDVSRPLRSRLLELFSDIHKGVLPDDPAFPILGYLQEHDLAFKRPVQHPLWQERTARWVANFTGDYDKAKDLIDRSVVLIVGIGGVGSIVAQQLCQSGIKRLVVVDSGIVNEEDLNRQAFYELADIGSKKVEALKGRVENSYRDVIVQPIDKQIQGTVADFNHLLEFDPSIIFLCADEPPSLLSQIVKVSIGFGTPIICGGVGLMDGYVSPVLTRNDAKRRFLTKCIADEPVVTSSLAMTNSIVASYMAYRGFRFLLKPDDKKIEMHLNFQ